MKIGILQTGHTPAEMSAIAGNYAVLFEKLLGTDTFDYQVWNVVDGVFPDGIEDADGWLITGSRHGAYEDHAWIAPLETFIRALHAAKRPLVGVCFGHQIIAQALGGTVQKYDGGWSVGRQVYRFGDQELALNAWHQDQVTTLPDGARRLASTDFCENAALAWGDHIFTIQPHPEFQSDFIKGLIETRGKGVVPPPLLAQAEARLGDTNNNAQLADMMARVLRGEGIA